MPQPQQQAEAWNCGECETHMNVPDAQQWPPQVVLSRNLSAVPHRFHTPPDQRFHKTPNAMDKPDWNGVFQFEGEAGFADANQIGSAASNDIFPSSHQHNTWGNAPSHLPPQQLAPPAFPSNGHTNNSLSDRWSLRQDSITSQSGRAPHGNTTARFFTNAWPLQSENMSVNALQSSSTATSETGQTNITQRPAAAAPSIMSASYSSTGTISFGIQTSNAAAYKIEPPSPVIAPQTLHGGFWDYFNPMNHYPNTISTQSYLPPQPGFSADFHGLPAEIRPQTQRSEVPNPAQDQDSFVDDAYSVSPAWVDWQHYDAGFSSGSEVASPISPAIPAVAQGDQSFCSSVDSTNGPIPPLSYSQSSPASDLEHLTSSYPGRQHLCLDHEDNVHQEFRSQSLPADQNNSLATLAPQPRCPTTWLNRSSQQPPAADNNTRAAHRAKRDDLLVHWKRAGMSYRQIRDKGGFTEAESTLRGRFRTLTKTREERVRKPLWMAKDVYLLREGVKLLMAGSLYPGMGAADMDVGEMDIDANRVPWKKVAEYIVERGGSYLFGNATCKKQWLKIQGKLREQ